MRRTHAVLAVVATALVAGCGAAEPPVTERPGTAPYAGPLHVPIEGDEDAPVTRRAGAAARALECDGEPYNGGTGAYDDGLATVQDHPETALVNHFSEGFVSDELPDNGYRIERRDGARALLSFDVEGRTKVAVVTADGIRDFNGSHGWGVETWAQCDPAEFPAAFTDARGIGIWEDAAGARVPTTEVRSFQGAEHCDWQDLTYLVVGPDEERWFLRDTTGGEFDGLLRSTFDPSATLPQDATDTGWRRDGRVLWLSEDAAYLVAVDDPQDVERWPAQKEPILCS